MYLARNHRFSPRASHGFCRRSPPLAVGALLDHGYNKYKVPYRAAFKEDYVSVGNTMKACGVRS